MYLGIDLTSSERKPSGAALLSRAGSLAWLGFLGSDRDILSFVEGRHPRVVAIDAPLGFPRGMDCLEESHPCESEWSFKGRQAHRAVIERGMSIYVITKRTFIKAMAYRAVSLAKDLRGLGCEVIEVYPYASKVSLFPGPIPKKTSREGRRFLTRQLRPLIPGLEREPEALSHDLCDALVAAHRDIFTGPAGWRPWASRTKGRSLYLNQLDAPMPTW